jgi:hypothetical protein
MSAQWRLNGILLSDWGIGKCVLTRRSFAADTLDFRVDKEDALAEPQLPYGTTVTLTRQVVVYFAGKIVREQALGGRDREAHGYQAANAWHDLERIVYQQTRCMSDATFNFDLFVPTLTPQVVLGQTDFGGSYLTTTAQMQQVLLYAIGRGVQLLPGAWAGGVPFAREEAQSLTCAEVIRRLAAMTPDAVTWMDYTTGTPTLHFGRRGSLTAVNYNLLAGDAIVDWRVESRPDLVPAGVRFSFIKSEVNEGASGDGLAYTRAIVQQAGNPDGPGGLIAALEVHGGDSETMAPIPGNLAAEYYLGLQSVPYEGQLVTKGRDVRGDLMVRHVLNLSGGRAAWGNMRALVQQVEEDIISGETTVEFGLPERLPAQDFVDQLMFVRRVRPSINLQAVRTCRLFGPDVDDEGEVDGSGEDEVENPNAGKDPAGLTAIERFRRNFRSAVKAGGDENDPSHGTVDLKICKDGAPATVRVLGTLL